MWNTKIPLTTQLGRRSKFMKLKNITKDYWEFLHNGEKRLAEGKDFSIIIGILGMRGIGKTFTECKIIYEFIKENPSKKILVWGSPGLVTALKLIFQNVELINSSREIKPNSLVVFDEALLELNGKEALTVKMREFGKTLAILRHVNISAIICSQTLGFINDLRSKVDQWIIKRMPETATKDLDFLPKTLRLKVSNLPISKAILLNNYYLFKQKLGGLVIDLKDFPLWNNEISRNMEGTNLDQELKKITDEREQIILYAREMINVFGKSVMKSKFISKMKGYYYIQNPEIYTELKTKFEKIADVAVYLMEIEKPNISDGDKQENQTQTQPIPDNVNFAEYCYQMIKWDNPPDAEIIKLFLSKITQEDIAKDQHKQLSQVNTIIKKFRETDMGNMFEDWFNLIWKTGYKAPHNTSEPDCIFPISHEIYPGEIFSLKVYCDRSNCMTFYQTPPDDDKKFMKNFGPEYRYAKQHDQKYNAVLLNPFWDTNLRIIRNIDPILDENKIVFFKSTEVLEVPINQREEAKDETTITVGDVLKYKDEETQEYLLDGLKEKLKANFLNGLKENYQEEISNSLPEDEELEFADEIDFSDEEIDFEEIPEIIKN